MKILLVITKSAWGGAQRYVFDLAMGLPTDRFDVAVAAGDGGGVLTERLRKSGIRTIPLTHLDRDIFLLEDVRSFWELVCVFRKERPDIIHLNSSKIGGLGAIAARVASLTTGHRSLVIFTAHGWSSHEEWRPKWQRIVIVAATMVSSWFQDRVIVLSQSDEKTARHLMPRRKLRLIPLGIAPPLPLARNDARRELAERTRMVINSDTAIIGTVAELTANKNIGLLVNAAARLRSLHPARPWRIIIIGDGELRAQLKLDIHERGLAGVVALAGFITDASRLLSAFNIFVLPSLKEGLPYALMEAMVSGVACIATRVGGIPDLIQDGETGLLVPSGDSPLLASAITSLLNNPRRREALGERARRRITDRFDVDAMMRATMHLYTERS